MRPPREWRRRSGPRGAATRHSRGGAHACEGRGRMKVGWLIVPALLATACGAHMQHEATSAEAAPDGASVHVVNAYTLPVDVIAIGPAGNVQLGRVSPGMHGRFPLSSASIRNGV